MLTKIISIIGFVGIMHTTVYASQIDARTPFKTNQAKPMGVEIYKAIESGDTFELLDLIDDYLDRDQEHKLPRGAGEYLILGTAAKLNTQALTFLFEDIGLNKKFTIDKQLSNKNTLLFLLHNFSLSYHLRDVTSSDIENYNETQLKLVNEFYKKRADIIQVLIDKNDLKLDQILISNFKIIDYALAVDDIYLFNLFKRNSIQLNIDDVFMRKALSYKALKILNEVQGQYRGDTKRLTCNPIGFFEQQALIPIFSTIGVNDTTLFGSQSPNYTSSDTWAVFVGKTTLGSMNSNCSVNANIYQLYQSQANTPSFSNVKTKWGASATTPKEMLKFFY